jgi:hypothetical protein
MLPVKNDKIGLKRILKYLVFTLALLSMAGCTVEQKLATRFTQARIVDDFLLIEPDLVFKYNLKTYEFPGIDTLPEAARDSVMIANSLFLPDIDDSLFIRTYSDSFFKAIGSYGMSIYPENYLDTFLLTGRKAIIIHLAQLSLEEYVHPYESEEVINDEIVVIDDIDLNALNYNVWIELSYLNEEGRHQVLFGSDFLLDDLEGILKQYLFTGETRFDYTIDTITTSKIYAFAGEFGKKTAGYLYDYYLNRYVDENLPKDYQFERYYYHYDPEKKRAYPVDPANSLIELSK